MEIFTVARTAESILFYYIGQASLYVLHILIHHIIKLLLAGGLDRIGGIYF